MAYNSSEGYRNSGEYNTTVANTTETAADPRNSGEHHTIAANIIKTAAKIFTPKKSTVNIKSLPDRKSPAYLIYLEVAR